jgi:hypothetical protein
LVRLLHDIGTRSEVQERLRSELAAELGEGEMSLNKRYDLPFLTACFYETLRTTSSAIVPHMANRDTSISGSFKQSCGSGSTGSTYFWASWIRIRILLLLSKNSKKNLVFYFFVTSF